MKRTTLCAITTFTASLLAAGTASADVKLPAIFSDNMVLQADKKVPVWGTAEPGEKIEVRVSIDKAATTTAGNASSSSSMQAKQATADDKGNWKVVLDALPASDEPIGFVVTGNNKVSIENVLVGEVWVASGQSNMEWPVRASNDAEKEIAEANYPEIRLFQVKKAVSPAGPVEDVEGHWAVCTPETVANFSAVAYFFGREIQNGTSRPVGLIGTYWGGTPAEAWTSREKLESVETLKPLVTNWEA